MEYNHQEAVEAAKKELNEKYGKKSEIVEDNVESTTEEQKTSITLSNGEIVIFNFDYLTGKTILNLKNEFKRKQKTMVMMEELDDAYCTFVASKISNKTYEEILELNYQDWSKVKNFVKDFLLGV